MAYQEKQQKSKSQNTESLEKYFFIYILENPKFFSRVNSIAFKNIKIKFVFDIIQRYYIRLDKPIVPSNNKILELIRLEDPDSEYITKEYLAELLRIDLSDMVQGEDDDYLKKAFYSWMTCSNMKSEVFKAIEDLRDMSEIDYSNTEMVAEKLRTLVSASTIMNYDDDDLGLDFFDPESHFQNAEHSKISTGWNNIDTLLNGGWARKTLNIICGGSNSGKSLILCNIGVNAADHGKNVLYVTLEMSEKEVIKRMGSKWLKIPIDQYDTKSKDRTYMQGKLKELTTRSAHMTENDMFNTNMGKIFIKEYASGTCTLADIDNCVKNYEDKKGVKIDMVIVDYLTIMQPEKGEKGSQTSLFTNGKYLSNGLRAIAQRRDLVMVTAMQISKDQQGATDINMNDISESKAIYENADILIGILRTSQMRIENKYILKLLKYRSGAFAWERTHFDLDPTYMSIINDKRMD